MSTIPALFLLAGAAIAVVVGANVLVVLYRTYRRGDRRSRSIDAVLLGIVGVVALAVGGATLVERPTDTTTVAVLGSALAGVLAVNAVLYQRVVRS